MTVARMQPTPALRNPREIPVYALCVVLNVILAVVLVGLAILMLVPTPVHAVALIATPLRLAIAAILLAAFVVGISIVLGRQLLRASSRGNSVLASPNQFPEIDAILRDAAIRLSFGRGRPPEIYVENGNGVLNAFAASTFAHDYVVVNSGLFANTLEQNQRALRFIVGHELGHIRLGHTRFWYQMSVCFSSLVPLLGPYLSRLRELSCDRHWARVEPEGSDGLVLLTAGRYIYQEVHLSGLLDQAHKNVGFWNTVAQLPLSHPFTVRRIAELNRLGLIGGSSAAAAGVGSPPARDRFPREGHPGE